MATLQEVSKALSKRLGQAPLRQVVKDHHVEVKYEGLRKDQVTKAMNGLEVRYLKQTNLKPSFHAIEGQWVYKKPGAPQKFRFTLFVYKDHTQVFFITDTWSDKFVTQLEDPTLTKVKPDAKKWSNDKIEIALDEERMLAVKEQKGWVKFADLGQTDLRIIKKLIDGATTPFDTALNKYFKALK